MDYHTYWKITQKDIDSLFDTLSYRDVPSKIKYRDKPRPKIKKVIFNDPATIIYWTDGSKTVVKCQNGEPFDAEKGFVMAYLKKLLGNDNTFNKEIAKWVTE